MRWQSQPPRWLLTSIPAQAQVSPETLKSISIPDKVESPIGKLEFFDGVPTDATTQRVYDNLDRMRAVEVFLDNVAALSVYGVIAGNAAIGLSQPNQIAVAKNCSIPIRCTSPATLPPCIPSAISI